LLPWLTVNIFCETDEFRNYIVQGLKNRTMYLQKSKSRKTKRKGRKMSSILPENTSTIRYPELFKRTQYSIISELQQSLYGTIKLAWDSVKLVQVVIKISEKRLLAKQKSKSGVNIFESIYSECELLSLLTQHHPHPNIIAFIDQFEDDYYHYLITEYCETDLFTYLCRFKGVDGRTPAVLQQLNKLFLQIAEGVEHLHQVGIAHLDLSLENICLQPDPENKDEYRVKIIDFGLAIMHPQCNNYKLFKVSVRPLHDVYPVYLSDNRWDSEHFLCTNSNTLPGKAGYMSPEMHSRSGIWCAFSNDCYALGVILYAMLVGYPAYKEYQDKWFHAIFSGNWMTETFKKQPATRIYHHLSPECMHLIDSLITSETSRLTIKQIKSHPYFQSQAKQTQQDEESLGNNPKRRKTN
jgi:cell cycle serine/threonine-protein kinase CDC5/MSD2